MAQISTSLSKRQVHRERQGGRRESRDGAGGCGGAAFCAVGAQRPGLRGAHPEVVEVHVADGAHVGAPTLCAALRRGRRPGVVVHQNSVVAQVLSKPRVANSSPIILNFLARIDLFSLSSPSCVPCHPPRHPVQRPRRQRLREAGEAAALVTGGAQLLQMVEPVETDKTNTLYIFSILREIFFLLCEIVVQPPPHDGGQRLRRQKRR